MEPQAAAAVAEATKYLGITAGEWIGMVAWPTLMLGAGWLLGRRDQTRSVQVDAVCRICEHLNRMLFQTLDANRLKVLLRNAQLDQHQREQLERMRMDVLLPMPEGYSILAVDRYLVGVAWGSSGDPLAATIADFLLACQQALPPADDELVKKAHARVFAEIDRLEKNQRSWWRRLIP